MRFRLFPLLWLCKCAFAIDAGVHGFDDSVLYSINWPGVLPNERSQDGIYDALNYDELVMQTDAQETYKCYIPKTIQKEMDMNEKYVGPNSVELLNEIVTLSSCSYRLEPFWTYELCHGRFIRQYHEEREGKKVKIQEYYLGKWDPFNQQKLKEALEFEETNKSGQPPPVKKIDGMYMPYIQLNMSDGTFCEIINKERVTSVLYVCYALGKHEIYSMKETSTCEYEIIVLSPLLCVHPKYRPQASGENAINCIPQGQAAIKPKSLHKLEVESVKLRHQSLTDDLDNVLAVLFDNVPNEGGVPRVRLELLSVIDDNGPAMVDTGATEEPEYPYRMGSESSEFYNFIAGRDCVQGGSGWWKYEFCYGKAVTQYHMEKDGSKKVVSLGKFIKSGHLKWLEGNPHKRPVRGQQLSYLYTMGSICEETGKPRQTEVKLKCIEGNVSPGAVSLYLLEPKTCQYILGVESRMVCKLLQQVDNDGFLVHEDFVGFTRASGDYQEPAPTPEAKKPPTKKSKPDMKITVVIADEGNHIADGDE